MEPGTTEQVTPAVEPKIDIRTLLRKPEDVTAPAPAATETPPPPTSPAKPDLGRLRQIEADANQRRAAAARDAQARKAIEDAVGAKKQLDELKNSPALAALAKLKGISTLEAYKQVTNEVVGQETPPDPMQAIAETNKQLAEVRKAVEDAKAEAARLREQEQINSHQRSVVEEMKASTDFPAIKAMGAEEAVYWAMVGEWNRTGGRVRLTAKQAASIVEKSLVDDYAKLSGAGVFKPPPAPVTAAPKEPEPSPVRFPNGSAPRPKPGTISNRMASAPSTTVPRAKTEAEKWQETVDMLTKKA